MKKIFQKYGIYLIAPMIAIILMLIIYLLKGMYPFGDHTIIQADLGQGHIPNCYLMWDILHGKVGISWSFNLGLGLNVYGQNLIFDPLMWLFLFISRNQVIPFLNILLIIRVSLMALTSFYFFKKTFPKVSLYWLVMFSLLYSLGGYTLLTYHNIGWLDCLIVFPLFLRAMKHLFDKGKVLPYIILLTVLLVLGYYVAYMILMMIVFCGALGVHYYVEKDKRKMVATKLWLGTLAALALSCFSFLPTFMQSMSSYRIQSMTNGDTGFQEFFTKINYYLCSATLIVLPILSFIQFKKDKKMKKFLFLSLLFAMAGLILERVNMMWMTGSYMCFPYRYGFIPLMILSIISLHYLNEREEKVSFHIENKITKHDFILGILFTICAIITLFLIAGFGSYVTTYNIAFGLYDPKVIATIFSISICFILLFLCSYFFQSKGFKYITLTIVIIGQILVTSYWYLGINPAYTTIEHSDVTAKRAEEMKEEFEIHDNYNLDRYRDASAYFDENYAHILGVPTISNWIHIVKEEQMVSHQRLGYATRYTKMQDLGGTIFSDALYHVKYSFHKEEQNNPIFQLLDYNDQLYLYERETLPIGIFHDDQSLAELPLQNPFEVQNQIYRTLFYPDHDIISIQSPTYKVVGASKKDGKYIADNFIEGAYLETTLSLPSSSLYLTIDEGYLINKITINDKVVDVPVLSYGGENTSYPTYNNTGILHLGDYEGTITIRFYFSYPLKEESIHLGSISFEDYQTFLEENQYESEFTLDHDRFTIKMNNQEHKSRFMIPISYDEGWTATVNGEKVEVSRYLGNFIDIPIKEGDNIITFTYTPPYLTQGIQISIVTLFLLIIVTLINKKWKIDQNNIFTTIFWIISILTYVLFLFVIYIRPYL